MSHKFHPNIIRAYDIRGIVDVNLNAEDAYHLGRSFATFMNDQGFSGKIAISRDGRLSSPSMHESLIKGLNDSGKDIIDIGLMPTPALYYATHTLDCSAGIMITGSHNPGDQNGFKMVMHKSSFYGDDIKKLAEIAFKGEYSSGEGGIEEVDISSKYIDEMLEKNNLGSLSDLKVAWDPGNGATGQIVEKLTRKLNGQHFVINSEIDGKFPAHHPDPTMPENMLQLCKLVTDNGCDLGVAFDGDGDRIG